MSTQNSDFKSMLAQLETNLDMYLGKKAPQLPENWKELIVKVSPWLTLIAIILTLPLVLALFGIGAFLAPFSFLGGMHVGLNFILSYVVLAVTIVMEAMAIPDLFKRRKSGWNKVYYAQLLSIVANILTFNIGGAIVGGLIGLYILFQVRPLYK